MATSDYIIFYCALKFFNIDPIPTVRKTFEVM